MQAETPTLREKTIMNRGWVKDGAISDDVDVYELKKDGGDYYIGFTTLVKCNDYRYDTLFKMLSNVVCAYTLDVVYNGEGSFQGIAASMWSYDYLQKEFDEDPDKLTQHFAKSFDKKTGEFTSDVVLKYPVKYDEKGERI